MEKIFEEIKSIVNINSHSYNKSGVDKVGEAVKSWLSFMKVKEYKSNNFGNLLHFKSQYKSNYPKILLCGHSDTVHPKRVDFPIVLKGNKLYGPGTNDMKGGIVIVVEVLRKLYKKGFLYNVDFLLNPDEELGSRAHSVSQSKIYKNYDLGMVFEASGRLPGIQKKKSKARTTVIERKGVGAGIFSISSPGGHSGVIGLRKDRKSANLEAAYKAVAIESLADYKKGTTTNVGILKGGTAVNTLAMNCVMEVDYRVKKRKERKRIRNAYEKLSKKSFIKGTKTSFEWKVDMFPLDVTKERKEFSELVKWVGLRNSIEVLDEKRGGGSDANYMVGAGINVLDGFGPQGENDHTTKEFLYIDSLEPSKTLAYHTIIELQRRYKNGNSN